MLLCNEYIQNLEETRKIEQKKLLNIHLAQKTMDKSITNRLKM